jgi:hypothetical protein
MIKAVWMPSEMWADKMGHEPTAGFSKKRRLLPQNLLTAQAFTD